MATAGLIEMNSIVVDTKIEPLDVFSLGGPDSAMKVEAFM